MFRDIHTVAYTSERRFVVSWWCVKEYKRRFLKTGMKRLQVRGIMSAIYSAGAGFVCRLKNRSSGVFHGFSHFLQFLAIFRSEYHGVVVCTPV